MAKNIVIFSDGTGQEGGKGNNTNIYKLFNMIEDRTASQVAFYDPGLGTGWRKISGSVGGAGMSRNIQQCYRFIFDNYSSGDQIYLFGFSRGAATVRSLSSFIHYFGILPQSRPELIKQAYKIYKISDEKKRQRKAKDFVDKHHTMWTRVKFLGCYDTVAALGLPSPGLSAAIDFLPWGKHKFHNFRLSESVEHAYHALAIDDERQTFHPVLWDREAKDYQTIRQVWFAGMHTDVGGGYEEQDLSDIPLVWMTDMAVRNGLRIYSANGVRINEDANGFMHDSRGKTITRLYRKKQRKWKRDEKPVVHQSVMERTANQKNKNEPPYKPWVLQYEPEVEPWVKYSEQSWRV